MIIEKHVQTISRAEPVLFPELTEKIVYSRIDTGARTSSIWGNGVVTPGGNLRVVFFDDSNIVHEFKEYKQLVVATSTGHTEQRYAAKILVVIAGRRIRATFTIANRSTQVYPVLIGRNILKGKFLVDVEYSNGLDAAEKKRFDNLQKLLSKNPKEKV